MHVIERLLQEKLVAVIRADDPEQGYRLAEAAYKGGIKAIEITFTVPRAAWLISTLKDAFKEDMLLGAGTVIDERTCKTAIEHGAQYIVSPGFDEATALYCHEKDVPYMPGCMTVTEMMWALKHHVRIIKLFPGSHFGTKFIKSIKAPLPDIKVMVTGGVDMTNIKDWLVNGADLIGIGSDLTKPGKHNDFEAVTQTARKYRNQIEELRTCRKS